MENIARIEEAMSSAKEFKSNLPKPIPLIKKLEKGEPYPIDFFPDVLKNAIIAINDITQAPMAICGQSVLATANLITQALADVKTPIHEVKPISEIFLSIIESGERKSSCDRLALKPVREYERKLQEEYEKELQEYNGNLKVYKAKEKNILKNSEKKNFCSSSLESELKKLGEEPKKPVEPLLIMSEPTIEGLEIRLLKGYPSIGIFNDDAGDILGGYSMNNDNKLKTISKLSKFWDGGSCERIRASETAIKIYGKRVSMHLMTQPSIANILLSDNIAKGQGFLSRILITAPENTAGTRFLKEGQDNSIAYKKLNEYYAQAKEILHKKLKIKEGKQNELIPREISLTEGASKIWVDFFNHVEVRCKDNGEFYAIKPLANKIAEHAMRISSTLVLFDNPDAEHIEFPHMQWGIDIAQYYLNEALRLANSSQIDPITLKAKKLVDYLKVNWSKELISAPDIYQNSMAGISDVKSLKPVIKLLIENYYLIPIEGKHEVNGANRKEVYRLNLEE